MSFLKTDNYISRLNNHYQYSLLSNKKVEKYWTILGESFSFLRSDQKINILNIIRNNPISISDL